MEKRNWIELIKREFKTSEYVARMMYKRMTQCYIETIEQDEINQYRDYIDRLEREKYGREL